MDSPFTTLDALTADLVQARAAAGAQIDDQRRQITDCRTELRNTRDGLLPLQEVRANVAALIRQYAAVYLENDGHGLVYGQQAPARHGFKSHSLPWSPSAPIPFGLLAAADPIEAERLIMGAIEQIYQRDGTVVGLSSAARPAAVARLEQQLQALEDAEEAAIDRAIAGGVSIAHRPEVIARRAQEAELARQREAQAKHEEYLRQHEAARLVDEAARQRAAGRFAPSQYLTRAGE